MYTSGDSVFQIACRKAIVPLDRLYEWCRIARELLVPPHRVGRVIARPFEGEPGAFVRSPERRDLSVPPPGPTVLDALQAAAVPVYGVGKIQDIFDRQGITEACYSDSNDHGVDLTIEYLGRPALRSSSRTSWTSTRSTGTATTRRATPLRWRRSTGGSPS